MNQRNFEEFLRVNRPVEAVEEPVPDTRDPASISIIEYTSNPANAIAFSSHLRCDVGVVDWKAQLSRDVTDFVYFDGKCPLSFPSPKSDDPHALAIKASAGKPLIVDRNFFVFFQSDAAVWLLRASVNGIPNLHSLLEAVEILQIESMKPILDGGLIEMLLPKYLRLVDCLIRFSTGMYCSRIRQTGGPPPVLPPPGKFAAVTTNDLQHISGEFLLERLFRSLVRYSVEEKQVQLTKLLMQGSPANLATASSVMLDFRYTPETGKIIHQVLVERILELTPENKNGPYAFPLDD
jgi:hypothetical protein